MDDRTFSCAEQLQLVDTETDTFRESLNGFRSRLGRHNRGGIWRAREREVPLLELENVFALPRRSEAVCIVSGSEEWSDSACPAQRLGRGLRRELTRCTSRRNLGVDRRRFEVPSLPS